MRTQLLSACGHNAYMWHARLQTGKLLGQMAVAAGVPQAEREVRMGEALRRLQASSQFRFIKNMVQLAKREAKGAAGDTA